jgi:ABC-type multidrug transport system fused ATPase/permease subunit
MRLLPPLATRDRILDAVLVVLCGIAQAAALAVAAFATRDAFAALHQGQPIGLRTILELGLAGVFGALCLLVSRRRAEALGQSYAICLRRILYRQIARLPKSRHDERRVGALSLRFVGDLSAARLWFGRGLPDVLSAAVVLPGALAILFVLDPALAVAGSLPLGGALVLMAAIAWHLERRHRTLRRRRASIAIGMIERIAIAPHLDLMGRTTKELRALDEQGTALRADAVARRGRTVGLQAVLQVGLAFAGLVMLWTAGRNGVAPATVAASLSVIALVALPMQDLGGAWDRYCAWRVAREKALRLLAEPTLKRRSAAAHAAATVSVTGTIDETPIDFEAPPGEVTILRNPLANRIAQCISGLDHQPGLKVSFDGKARRPRIAHIGDDHIGLQGSLRRSATLMSRKRPDDARIREVLEAFGLGTLLGKPRGLDQRLAENGRGLAPEQSLRLDLARAVLGEADIIVIASLRWAAEPERDILLRGLGDLTPATIILANLQNTPTSLRI